MVFPSQAERRAYREAEINMMDDLSEADFQKEEDPASPAPPPSQQHTDPASPTVAVTPEPVARGDQGTPSEIEYQVCQLNPFCRCTNQQRMKQDVLEQWTTSSEEE